MIDIFLVDDHAVVRDGYRRILEAERDLRVVGEASNGATALSRAAQEHWDVLVLDLELPDLSGQEVLRQVRELRPKLPVLVMSMYQEELFAPRLFQAGARGYLSKERTATDLVTAVRHLHAGRTYLHHDVALRIVNEPAPVEALSSRELEVLRLLVGGRTSSQIAVALGLSPSTVSTHLHRIKARVGARSLAELVQFALRSGIHT